MLPRPSRTSSFTSSLSGHCKPLRKNEPDETRESAQASLLSAARDAHFGFISNGLMMAAAACRTKSDRRPDSDCTGLDDTTGDTRPPIGFEGLHQSPLCQIHDFAGSGFPRNQQHNV